VATFGTRNRYPLSSVFTTFGKGTVAVRLRLTRVGGRKNPIWRVVAADQRSKRDGRVLETIGHYNAQTQPSTIVLDEERVRHWLARGAQPTETVSKLLKTQGISGPAGS
jgi:small subunit ribosomal protein S16